MTRIHSPTGDGSSVHLPWTGTWVLNSADGEAYKIQVAWPMQWMERYIVDGNALFLTATEAAWRRGGTWHFKGGGIIVAVGYPLTDKLFSPRRNYDLTPPRIPPTSGEYGGAEKLLDFIQNTVKPFIANEVFAGSTLGREALYGHSLGGLFALYTLYIQPSLFDSFLSSSPSIFFDNRLIIEYEKRFVEGQDLGNHRPELMISYGTWEQHVPRWSGETEEDYKKRSDLCEEWAMEDNVKSLYSRLRDCEFLSAVKLYEYPDEDHGSVMACSMSRFLTTFFEGWPVSG